MGKRKERRLAAQSNAGRRVKLDLFAEPSGDLGGSSVHDEVGGNIESKDRACLPNSPTSSDQQPQNPLLLLGQYSDDELDDESNNKLNHATVEGSSHDNYDQDKGPLGEGCEDMDANAAEDLPAQKVNQQDMEGDSTPVDVVQNLEGSDTRESDATNLCREMDSTEQNFVPGTSDVQVVGDVGLGWKIVMHEESNQCYYWNTDTGETSWEVPDVLARTTESTPEQKTTGTDYTESAPAGAQESNSTFGVELASAALTTGGSMDANLIPQTKEMYAYGPQMDEQVEGCKSETLQDKNWVTDVNPIELQSKSDTVSALLGDGRLAGSEKYMHDAPFKYEHKTGINLSTSLVKQSEGLLERLKSLRGSNSHLEGHDWISKCILEVEIRLSDIKSLLSYGPSLIPFWVHSERQIKRLEVVINDEIHQLESARMNVEATCISLFREKDRSLENMGHEPQADGKENNTVFSTCEISHVSTSIDAVTVCENDTLHQLPYSNAVYSSHVSSFGSPTRHMGSGAAVSEQVNGTALPGVSKHGSHVGEDVDMDVDMEVEDVIISGSTAIGDELSVKNLAPQEQQNPHAEQSSLALNDVSAVPPPPDEEWIPPPPPDNELVPPPPPDNELIPPPPPDSEQVPPPPPDSEQVPPPPPDDPPEPSYPPLPSFAETGQPFSYTEQYNLTYPGSNFQYFGHPVVEVPCTNFYGHADGCQGAVPHTSLYYEAVPNTFSETAPVIINPVEPVAYYDLQGETAHPISVASSVHSESVPVSYDSLTSGRIGYVDVLTEAGPNVEVDVSAGGAETKMEPAGDSFTSTTSQAPATISAKASVSVPSTGAVTAPAAVAAPSSSTAKVQSKVLRSKKRTVAVAPSLRSNKKVSSMVDKWKAAKEEMNENEEDEPENAYEILEKKRQREIQEWHAQQIASGEAKDNANFQPLGGDWRERVKRRRAQAAREAAQTPPKALTDENQQPDIAELSRDLPAGWQAYWDETSKQIYYGSTITLETTWTRPTK